MENDRFLKLNNLWNVIGPFNMGSFSDRLILQKKVYLLKEMGFDIGYEFRKYIHGPYSSSLASDGYKMEVGNLDSGNRDLSPEILKKLEILGKGRENDPLWFELLASALFLLKREGVPLDELKEKISEEKPHLDIERDLDNALSLLREVSIIN